MHPNPIPMDYFVNIHTNVFLYGLVPITAMAIFGIFETLALAPLVLLFGSLFWMLKNEVANLAKNSGKKDANKNGKALRDMKNNDLNNNLFDKSLDNLLAKDITVKESCYEKDHKDIIAKFNHLKAQNDELAKHHEICDKILEEHESMSQHMQICEVEHFTLQTENDELFDIAEQYKEQNEEIIALLEQEYSENHAMIEEQKLDTLNGVRRNELLLTSEIENLERNFELSLQQREELRQQSIQDRRRRDQAVDDGRRAERVLDVVLARERSLRSLIRDLETENARSQAFAAQLREQNDGLTASLQEANRENGDLKKLVEFMGIRNQEINEMLCDVRGQNFELTGQVDSLRVDKAKYEVYLEEVTDEKAKLEADLEKVKEELMAYKRAFDDQKDFMRDQSKTIRRLRMKHSDVVLENLDLERNVLGLIEVVDELSADNEELNEKEDALTRQVEQCQKEMKELEEDKFSKDNDICRLEAEISQFEQSISDIKAENQELIEEMESLKDEAAMLDKQKDALLATVEDTEIQKQALESNTACLQNLLEEKSEDLTSLREENQKLAEEKDELEERLVDARKESKDVQGILHFNELIMRGLINSHKEEKERMLNEQNILQQALEASEEDRLSLQEDVAILEDDLEEVEAEKAGLKREKGELSKKLEKMDKARGEKAREKDEEFVIVT